MDQTWEMLGTAGIEFGKDFKALEKALGQRRKWNGRMMRKKFKICERIAHPTRPEWWLDRSLAAVVKQEADTWMNTFRHNS